MSDCDRPMTWNELRDEMVRYRLKARTDDSISRVCSCLPDGWSIQIDLERGCGSTRLFDPCDNEVDFPSNRECMADELEDALAYTQEMEKAEIVIDEDDL